MIASHLSIVPQNITVKDLTHLTCLTNLTMVDDPTPDLALIAPAADVEVLG
jgi:hypothetical protein